jgi:hypothetical protein
MKKFIFSIFILTPALGFATAQADGLSALFDSFHRESNMSNRLSCQPPENNFLWGQADSKAFFAAQSCDELFRTDTPPDLKKNLKAGIFAKPNNWSPVCSAYHLHEIKIENPLFTDNEVMLALNKKTRQLDQCAELPGNTQYPTAKSKEVIALSKDEKKEIEDGMFSQVRGEAATACCGQDQGCLNEMNKVKLTYCSTQKPDKPDQCLEEVATYSAREDLRDWHHQNIKLSDEELKKITVGKFGPIPSSIAISPYAGVTSSADIFHELGHACSYIRRTQALNRGDDQVLAEVDAINSDSPDESFSSYDQLFQSIGLKDEAITCMNNLAKNAKHARYIDSVCQMGRGDAHDYLEEGFAEAFKIMNTKSSAMVPGVLPNLCDLPLTKTTPLAADVFACLNTNPDFTVKMKAVLGCRAGK